MSLIVNTNIDKINKVTEIFPIGEVDIYTSPEFKATIIDIIKNNNTNIIINCEKLDYIDSTGLGAIMCIYKEIVNKNLYIKLKNVKPNIYKIFDITKLNEILNIEV